MKTKLLIAAIWMLFFLTPLAFLLPGSAAPPLPDGYTQETARGSTTGWEQVATGVEYREYYLSDPNMVYVARMERANISVTLETGIGSGYLDPDRETTSTIANRVDQSIGWWGQLWGRRSEVVVAVNGFYFDFDTGETLGGLVNGGWYAKRFDDLGGDSGFGWNTNRQAFIGECINHFIDKQIISEVLITDTVEIANFDGINVERNDNQLIVYTPQYSISTGTADISGTVEILVEMTRPTLILPWTNKAQGVVKEIRDGVGNTPIPFDHIVLAAHGVERANLLNHLQVGDTIGVSQEMRDYETDCATPLPSGETNWTKTYAGIGGDYHFLRNGEIGDLGKPAAQYRNPRTAVAFNDDYVFLIVVDGRNAPYSMGMNIEELALFARDTLSATNGITLDGGGSSTMVVNGEVKNNTYCNNVYCYHTFLPSVLAGIAPTSTVTNTQHVETVLPPTRTTFAPLQNPPDLPNYQRAVANSLMIVVVEPSLYSTATLSATQNILAAYNVEVRQGPGDNYGAQGQVSQHTPGVIVTHPLNGILAKGVHWWKVDFGGGLVGWIPENAILP